MSSFDELVQCRDHAERAHATMGEPVRSAGWLRSAAAVTRRLFEPRSDWTLDGVASGQAGFVGLPSVYLDGDFERLDRAIAVGLLREAPRVQLLDLLVEPGRERLASTDPLFGLTAGAVVEPGRDDQDDGRIGAGHG